MSRSFRTLDSPSKTSIRGLGYKHLSHNTMEPKQLNPRDRSFGPIITLWLFLITVVCVLESRSPEGKHRYSTRPNRTTNPVGMASPDRCPSSALIFDPHCGDAIPTGLGFLSRTHIYNDVSPTGKVGKVHHPRTLRSVYLTPGEIKLPLRARRNFGSAS